MPEASAGPQRVDGTMFFGAPKGFIGTHPTFIVYDGGRVETRYNSRPIKFCDGVWLFECPFEEIDPADVEKFVFKRQFNHAANEIKIGAGSSGGNVFNKLVDLLTHASDSAISQHEVFRWGLRSCLNHENRDKAVGIEIEYVEKVLRGEYQRRPHASTLFTGYGRQITEAVLYGPDRSTYPHETFDPLSHQSALHLGYAALECLHEEVIEQLLDGREVRIGDILSAIGAEVKDFKPEPLDIDGDL